MAQSETESCRGYSNGLEENVEYLAGAGGLILHGLWRVHKIILADRLVLSHNLSTPLL